MNEITLFERALRHGIRFPSSKGELTTEQLWSIPLESKSGFDLDTIAKAVNAELEAAGVTSFVRPGSDGKKAVLQLRLDVIKYIIKSKLDELDASKLRAQRATEVAQLTEILATKQASKLEGLTEEQIIERINGIRREERGF